MNWVDISLVRKLFIPDCLIQVRTQPLNDFEGEVFSANAAMDFLNKEDSNGTLIDFIKNRKKQFNGNSDEGSTQKQQILEELHVSWFHLYDLYIPFDNNSSQNDWN